MIQMEIDIKNKTIKLKEGVKLTDLQKMLQETLIDWQEYTIEPNYNIYEVVYRPASPPYWHSNPIVL